MKHLIYRKHHRHTDSVSDFSDGQVERMDSLERFAYQTKIIRRNKRHRLERQLEEMDQGGANAQVTRVEAYPFLTKCFVMAICIASRAGSPGDDLEHKWMTEFKPYFGPVRLPKRKLVQVKQHALLDLNKIKYEKQITMNPREKRDQL